mmetsp:Transcript_19407/g.33652  ORF Transcript_19407/g.33652 Transcript_19407/m.33652 type:complete len:226 (-) Transcript_19407:535-1212(-)
MLRTRKLRCIRTRECSYVIFLLSSPVFSNKKCSTLDKDGPVTSCSISDFMSECLIMLRNPAPELPLTNLIWRPGTCARHRSRAAHSFSSSAPCHGHRARRERCSGDSALKTASLMESSTNGNSEAINKTRSSGRARVAPRARHCPSPSSGAGAGSPPQLAPPAREGGESRPSLRSRAKSATPVPPPPPPPSRRNRAWCWPAAYPPPRLSIAEGSRSSAGSQSCRP